MSHADNETNGTPAEPEAILSLFDQIAQAGDTIEITDLVDTIRVSLGGVLPSIVLKQFVIRGQSPTDEQFRQLEAERDALQVRLAVFEETTAPRAEDGHYTLDQFMNKLQRVRGRTYGWRVDYVAATATSPGCRPVRNEDIQRWQQQRKVPDWAFVQIEQLVFPIRKGENGPQWTTEEYDFLVALYLGKADGYDTNSATPNAKFAEICSHKFGRTITENAIKGGLDRLRKPTSTRPARLPKYRSKEAAAA